MNMKKILAAASASVVAVSAIAVTSMTSSADISANIWGGSNWVLQSSTTIDATAWQGVAYWLSGDDLDKFESATVTLSNLGGFGDGNATAAEVYTWGEGQDWATVVQVGDKQYSVYDAVKAGLFNSGITELTINFDKSDLNGGNEIKVSTCQVSATVSLNVKLEGDTTSDDTSSDTSDDTSSDTSGDNSGDTSSSPDDTTTTPEGTKLTAETNQWSNGALQINVNAAIPGITNWVTTAAEADEILGGKAITLKLPINGAISSGKAFDTSKIGVTAFMQTNTSGMWVIGSVTKGEDGVYTMVIDNYAEDLKAASGEFNVGVQLSISEADAAGAESIDIYVGDLSVEVAGDETEKPGDESSTPGNNSGTSSDTGNSGTSSDTGNSGTSSGTANSGSSAIGTVTFPSSSNSSTTSTPSDSSASSDDKNTSESTPDASGDSSNKPGNPNTGVALSFLPIAAAAAGVVIFKKKK